jgi:K+-transporting ATPase KdpF subunit
MTLAVTSLDNWVALAIAVALALYLVVVLVRPERF